MFFCERSGWDWGAWSTPEAEVVAWASVVCHLICCGSCCDKLAGRKRAACWKAVLESRNRRAMGRQRCMGAIVVE